MTDDIVARLINPAGAGEAVALCREARKEIERLRDEVSALRKGDDSYYIRKLREAEAERAETIAMFKAYRLDPIYTKQHELAALRQDAERYRWLRQFRRGSPLQVITADDYMGDTVLIEDELDAAIDAAMKKE